MKVKFLNNVVKTCNAPTEQKIFKTVKGETVGTGWILILKLTEEITSAELDKLITAENVSSMDFLSETAEETETTLLFTLTGYNKITSSVIRHGENASATYAEIQLTKGV